VTDRARGRPNAAVPRVVVLAQDLIWATRLVSLVEAAGGHGKHARTMPEFDREAAAAARAIVDLTARNYDPIAAIERGTAAGLEVIGVGQHDDVSLRRRALAAGAARVLTYNQMHRRGAALVGDWLARVDTAPAARDDGG
jgi:hypothetical protein